MWKSYFFNIQSKYNMRVSTKEPLVIRFDGKDVTKDIEIDLLHEEKGKFMHALKESAKYYTQKYNAYAICGTDEISFIFINPMQIIEDLDSSKCSHVNEIISLFSQYFYNYFNSYYKDNGKNIYFHGKCFSISKEKVRSYIVYRAGSIKNVLATYVLKRNGIKSSTLKLEEKTEKCLTLSDGKMFESMQNGILYFNGNELNIQKYLSDGIEEIINNYDKNNMEEIEFDM